MTLIFLLFVPIIIGLLGLIFGKGDITWKEFLLQEVIMVVLISVSFFIAANARIMDKEVWSGNIVSKEKIRTSCCHSYPCNCHESCSGSGTNRSCTTHCDTCYQHSHDYTYIADTSNGETAYYNSCNAPHSSTPKRYEEIEIGEETAIEHRYKNYIKGNKSTILRRENIDKEFSIPEYPRVYDHYRIKRFIGGSESLDDRLDSINSDLGAKKQVNIIVIVTSESDQLYVEKLRQEWLGGKKNDFIVIISRDGDKINWADAVSWSDSEDAKAFTKNRIMALDKFDGNKVLDIIEEEVRERFVRKEMKDFEYLKTMIEPSPRIKNIIFFVGIVVSIILTIIFKREEVL